MTSDRLRKRIYQHYTSATNAPLAPDTVDGLSPRAAHLNRMIAEHFPADRAAKILELGCGHGALLHFARLKGYTNMQGVDGSPAQVAAARKLGIDGIREGDLQSALRETQNDSLDAVILFDVLEHLTRDEILDTVDAIHRVLKPGGRLILHVPNGASPFGTLMIYSDLTHEIAFTPESLAQLFLASGWRSVESFEDPPATHGLKSKIRSVLWCTIRAGLRFYLAVETGSREHKVLTQNLYAVAIK
ncbi:MAG: class I SAM-dependent methyltransferase [Proteobacteria bacterium]|nr:class I SAM-dependent methyltransferase [Pseudomonadota bacterium]